MIDVDQFRRNADYVERMGALTIRDAQAVKDWRAAADEITELRALALSLAEALERIERRDFLMADLKSVTTPERVASAALSSPALLKLKGSV